MKSALIYLGEPAAVPPPDARQGVAVTEDFRTERVCPRCRYSISPGFYHQEQPQPEGSNVVVCWLKRANGVAMRGPLMEVIAAYLDSVETPKP